LVARENSTLDGDAGLRIEAIVTIDRPLDRVWRFMTDFSNYPKIHPTFVEMKQTSSGPVGVGTTFDAMHQKAVYHLRIGEYEPNRKFTLEHVSGLFKGTVDIFTMETVEGRTRLSWVIDAKLGGKYKIAEPFVEVVGPILARGGTRELEAGLGTIKSLLESQLRP
jgi:carbon monoxide dehydrogenase subunit G